MIFNTFVGLILPPEIKGEYLRLSKYLEILGLKPPLINYIPHITLYFLGNQEEKNIPEIKMILQSKNHILDNNYIETGEIEMFWHKNQAIIVFSLINCEFIYTLNTELEKALNI
jgi:2'-5' RNA ligase